VATTITTGASHSILWNVENINETTHALMVDDSLVPVFFNEDTLAESTLITTFDPTVFSASSSQLADRSGVLGSVIRDRLDASGTGCSSNGSGADRFATGFGDPGASDCSLQAGTTVWAAGYGRHMDYDGDEGVVDHEGNHYGGVGGFDWTNGSGLTLGGMGGYGGESMDASSLWSSSYENTAQGFFAGFYGRTDAGPLVIDFEAAGGHLDHDNNRFVNDNLAQDDTGFYDGVSWRRASYDSVWGSVGASVSANIKAGDWTITPRVGGRYAMEQIDGYTETGGSTGTNAVVSSQTVEVAEGQLELALSRQALENVRVTGRGGYLARTAMGDDHVAVTLFETTEDVSTFANDPSSFYAGGNMVVDLPGNSILQIGGQVFFGDGGMSGYEGTFSVDARF
jgi:hypothetical protein